MSLPSEAPAFLSIERFIGGYGLYNGRHNVYYDGCTIKGKLNSRDVELKVDRNVLRLDQNEYPALILDKTSLFFPRRVIAPTTMGEWRKIYEASLWGDGSSDVYKRLNDIYLNGMALAGVPNEKISIIEKVIGIPLAVLVLD